MSILEKYYDYKSYKECKNIFKTYSKSYYLGSMIFPFEKFIHICAFYGLVRVADNIVDSKNLSENEKCEKLNEFIENFFNIYDLKDEDYKIIKNNNKFWCKYHDIFRALFKTIKEIKLERQLFERFFKSMKMDLEKYNYQTYWELEKYIDGSAAVIGEVMLKIMMYKDDYYVKNPYNSSERFEFTKQNRMSYANLLGNSFQMTNFIRDIREDYNMNPRRIYLPLEEINVYKLNFEKYNNEGVVDINFKEFITEQISRNKVLYTFSDIGINMLSPNDKAAIKLSRILYSRILDKIEEKDYELFAPEKIKVGFMEKMKIILNNIGLFNFIKIVIHYISYSYFFIIFFFFE